MNITDTPALVKIFNTCCLFAWVNLYWEGFLKTVGTFFARMDLHIPFKKLHFREGSPSPINIPKENQWSMTHDKVPVTSTLPEGWKISKISISAVRTFTRSNHGLLDIFLLV